MSSSHQQNTTVPKSTPGNKNEESLGHVLQRLAVDCRCRLLLVQHNNNDISLRKQVTSNTVHDELLQHFETPADLAKRQWQAHPHVWFAYMMQQIHQIKTKPRVYWWSTTSRKDAAAWLPPFVQTVNSVSYPDPFQWTQQQQNSNQQCSLHDLNTCLDYFSKQQQSASWIFIESLQPLLLLHGFDATWKCLQKVMALYTVVVPTPINGLVSSTQHRILEEAAWGVLCLQDDPVTWLRRGIRESSNLIRQQLQYRVVEDSKENASVLTLEIMIESAATETSNNTEDASAGNQKTNNRAGKVQLQFEKENHQRQPRIYLQDDDPEMQDEEDPDEDLDI